MSSKKQSQLEVREINKNSIRDGLEILRSHKRRTVVWPAVLIVNEYEFKCTLYDISLGGVRLKFDLPLATGAKVKIQIKNFDYTDALVSWHAEGFFGLRFTEDTDYIRAMLGEYGETLS
jgi:hypothetical protein